MNQTEKHIDSSNEPSNPNKSLPKPEYEAPEIKVLTEQEVLSAFQVTAAGTMMWWG